MKKSVLLLAVVFLLAAFTHLPQAKAESSWGTPGLSDNIPLAMPANLTVNNLDVEEGDKPLYVLVFADDEERATPWTNWAESAIERGDDWLAYHFGIDIRILGFSEWDTDDGNQDSLWNIREELKLETGHHLRTWYSGRWWRNYVDAVIGITAQQTPGDTRAGISSPPDELENGEAFIILRWTGRWWADDNLVQHEVSHLYFLDDHLSPTYPYCCAMSYHTHFHLFIVEGGIAWPVGTDVPCAYTATDWCQLLCKPIVEEHINDYIGILTITTTRGGTTRPEPGAYQYDYGEQLAVRALHDQYYEFVYWRLDGAVVKTLVGYPSIVITMDEDHYLEASFNWAGSGRGGGGGPFFIR